MTKIKYNEPVTVEEKLKYITLKYAMKFIAGSNFYYFDPPKIRDKVIFIPEPLNRKDSKAVAVYNCSLQKMGYLTGNKKVNEFVFDYLNGSCPAFGYVKAIENITTMPLYILDLSTISDRL
jgi:hypothetical protein